MSTVSFSPRFYAFIVVFLRRTDAKGTIREIVLPKGLDLDRPKRTRTSFTAEQLYRLELEFQRCQYVVGRERTELARQLNLSETQVRKKQNNINNNMGIVEINIINSIIKKCCIKDRLAILNIFPTLIACSATRGWLALA